MSEDETKTEVFRSMDDLKDRIELSRVKAERALNEYRSLVASSFGAMPKTEMQLVQFIERVLELKKGD